MNDSETPFKMDADRPLRMKIATLVAIIVASVSAAAYGVALKQDVVRHGEQLQTLVQRQAAIEVEARAQHDLFLETRGSLRLMDAKLDYLTNGRRGQPPAANTNP